MAKFESRGVADISEAPMRRAGAVSDSRTFVKMPIDLLFIVDLILSM